MAASEASANGAVSDERVEMLRSEMKMAGVDAYIVPSEDAHMVSPCYSVPSEPRADSTPGARLQKAKGFRVAIASDDQRCIGAVVACLHRGICSLLSHCSSSPALWVCVERICAGLRRAPPVSQPLHRLGGHSSRDRHHRSTVDRWSVLLAGAGRSYDPRKSINATE